MPMSRRRQLLLGAVGIALAGCHRTLSVYGVNLANVGLTGEFSLDDTQGHLRTLADFRGKVLLVMFGYTQCPDVCPTNLARIVQVMKKLGSRADEVQVLFITVDPERDTPTILNAYMRDFDPSFIGLRGDAAQTQQAANSYKAFYQKVPYGNSYQMNHSALDYVVDKQGVVRFALRYEESVDHCVSDIEQLL